MREPAGQWVNCLAIFLGGLAFYAPQFSAHLSRPYLNFFIAGAILGFFWPERGWQWGLWIAIPLATLGLINLANSMSMAVITDTAMSVGQAVAAGAVPGWLGSRYSPRRLPFPNIR